MTVNHIPLTPRIRVEKYIDMLEQEIQGVNARLQRYALIGSISEVEQSEIIGKVAEIKTSLLNSHRFITALMGPAEADLQERMQGIFAYVDRYNPAHAWTMAVRKASMSGFRELDDTEHHKRSRCE